jgi:hypothetical protein
MNRPELFVKSVDVLVHAFQNGKLENRSACNCAVGNLVSYRRGTYGAGRSTIDNPWYSLLVSVRETKNAKKKDLSTKQATADVLGNKVVPFELDAGWEEIESTEYTLNEIERIERAFERLKGNQYAQVEKPNTRLGLMRAIKVLGDIHEIPEETVQCMQEHVENNTYKFSHRFSNKRNNNPNLESCPVVKPLKTK